MELGTYFTDILKIILLSFFQRLISRLNCSHKVASYSDFSFFTELYRVKYLKCLRERNYILEHKYE